MLKFREFLVKEQKIQQSKKRLEQLISQNIEQFKREIQSNNLILESIQDIKVLKYVDLHQTEGDKRSLTKFLANFNKLNEQEQMKLVEELAKPYKGIGYIENNNQIKLILIYRNNKNSPVGQEAYNKVVLNKDRLFKNIAAKKVKAKSIYPSQAPDFVQEMYTALCGGGYYNEQTGGRYSIDGYDPYSGIPFNAFVMSMTIPVAFNRFQARYDTSVTGDYLKQREEFSTVSSDDEEHKKEVEDIIDPSQGGFDSTDQNIKQQLVDKVLNQQQSLPSKLQLNQTQKKFIKLYFDNKMSKTQMAKELGYINNPVPNVLRIQQNTINKMKKSIDYLLNKEK